MYGTTELPAAVIDEIARVVAAEVERVARLVPFAAAAELGRLSQSHADRGVWLRGSVEAQLAPGVRRRLAAENGLASLPESVAQRLLDALEMTVAALDPSVPHLLEALPEAAPGSGLVTIVSAGSRSEMAAKLAMLDAFVPGATDMVACVVAAVAAHPLVAPQLVGAGSDEAAIAASHGSRHLALAVIVTTIVLRTLRTQRTQRTQRSPQPDVTAAAIIGTALGVVAPILRDAPMPAGYAEAALARRQAEYLMPRHAYGRAVVTDHVFTLTEGPLESAVDFSENGLIAVLPDGIAVRAARESGPVSVALHVVEKPPVLEASRGDEIVEVSWRAPAGGKWLFGHDEIEPTQITPPWPGDYRIRVFASGRDEGNGRENYEFVIWRAQAADPVVHKQTDRLGYTLRSEPVPAAAPDAVYRWVESSSLSQAATVTFVADKSSSEVLRAFGADESAPSPIEELHERQDRFDDPWVCVVEVAGGTVAVEFNGWKSSYTPVLSTLSSPETRAASLFWNINSMTRFSLARNGEVLTNTEFYRNHIESSEALELLADLELEGRHRIAVGLLAASRFTGVWLSAEDLARIEAADIGYPILPTPPAQ
ncbi:DUF6461 domain-containing protein [Catenulispora yoronensis]|uniref:DUF6461 domain-containing protein n=1 Tax=Catenulispora yoronensis TaxID=450799 RepID=A0ABP5FPB3_9ACTN